MQIYGLPSEEALRGSSGEAFKFFRDQWGVV